MAAYPTKKSEAPSRLRFFFWLQTNCQLVFLCGYMFLGYTVALIAETVFRQIENGA